jgi:hypothetical protein
MNTRVVYIEVKPRADGKLYPPRPLSPAERSRIRKLAHNLVHRDRLSIRQAQRAMIEQHGLRRSLGAIHKDLVQYECGVCAGLDPANAWLPADG